MPNLFQLSPTPVQAINAFGALRDWLAKRTQQASGAIEAMRSSDQCSIALGLE